jgi:serine/threonine-protein phosphatase 2A regulatory subunit B'
MVPQADLLHVHREQQHAVHRYEAWQKMREIALQNAPGGKMPEGYVEIPHAPPPPPSAIDDADIMDLSMELNAASIDDVPGDLDEHGLERVPMADPGLDVCHSIRPITR